VGLNLDTKSYGIAVPEGSALRPLVSSSVIRLKEEGTIAALKRKWWQEERGGGACQAGFLMKFKKNYEKNS
jgi:ionotropic glutamate receptor